MTINIVDVRRVLADTINKVMYQGERVILERRGKGVAVLVSMEDLALLEKLEDEADVKAAREALAEMERTGEKPVPWEQVKAEIGLRGLGKGGADANGQLTAKRAKPAKNKLAKSMSAKPTRAKG